MSDDTRSIEVDYELPQPPEKVWRALTEPALLARWLMENDIKPEVGHAFTMRAQPIPGQWDGVVHCKVLEVHPQKLLRYAWKGGSGPGALDTTVTWTLVASGSGTRLHLSHAGFTADDAFALENMGKGWRSHLAQRIARALAEA